MLESLMLTSNKKEAYFHIYLKVLLNYLVLIITVLFLVIVGFPHHHQKKQQKKPLTRL